MFKFFLFGYTFELNQPPKKLTSKLTSTLMANTVRIQHSERGIPAISSVLFLPHFTASPPNGAPNRAPRRLKDANHEACCPFTGNASASRSCKEAIAGELYPFPRPEARGPRDTAREAKT